MDVKRAAVEFCEPGKCPLREKHFILGIPVCGHPEGDGMRCPEGRVIPEGCPLPDVNETEWFVYDSFEGDMNTFGARGEALRFFEAVVDRYHSQAESDGEFNPEMDVLFGRIHRRAELVPVEPDINSVNPYAEYATIRVVRL